MSNFVTKAKEGAYQTSNEAKADDTCDLKNDNSHKPKSTDKIEAGKGSGSGSNQDDREGPHAKAASKEDGR
ncbi:hypothetical protein PV08_09777 [Exophiala spinifera]|uniref:Uncharacterized protein n=1 Tax=Exophiala spinifera TaxID=91928 RepID=A0A0D2B1K6_9EURO|nr:uncharacterized protein PV08_09777 [Exophiala spinifera]KIW12500.1 hypothetical protein PV08_09777 [Exophiala spinifera]